MVVSEQHARRILLGTSTAPKSAQDLSRTHQIPLEVCTAILEFLERMGYVANVVTLSSAGGKAVKYYLRTEIKLREMYDELSPRPTYAPLPHAP